MQRLLTIVFLLAITACASPQVPHVTVHNDDFSNEIQFDNIWTKNASLGGVSYAWKLQSGINKKTHATSYRVFAFFIYFSDFKYFNSASDDKGNSLKVLPLYHQGGHCGVDSCKRIERIAVVLNEDELKNHATTGYRIRIRAKSEDAYLVTITPEMIRTQLSAMHTNSSPTMN